MTQCSKSIVVIPTYNEADNIPAILLAIFDVMPDISILVVDDSSPDGTAEKVKQLIESGEKRVLLKVRPEKQGLGAAYLDGFREALSLGYDCIIQMDADFSHQPHYLPQLFEQKVRGGDVVIGSRYVAGGGTRNWSFVRRFISRGGSLYSRTILSLSVHDVTAGYKLWSADILRTVIEKPLILGGFGFQIEMAYRTKLSGAKIVEIPIVFPDREAGESKMSGKIFKEALFGVWKLRAHTDELIAR